LHADILQVGIESVELSSPKIKPQDNMSSVVARSVKKIRLVFRLGMGNYSVSDCVHGRTRSCGEIPPLVSSTTAVPYFAVRASVGLQHFVVFAVKASEPHSLQWCSHRGMPLTDFSRTLLSRILQLKFPISTLLVHERYCRCLPLSILNLPFCLLVFCSEGARSSRTRLLIVRLASARFLRFSASSILASGLRCSSLMFLWHCSPPSFRSIASRKSRSSLPRGYSPTSL